MPDGRTFNNPRSIEPGWDLLLPADAINLPGDHAPADPTEAVVEPGDTLSGISAETGVGNWQELYEANQDVIGDVDTSVRDEAGIYRMRIVETLPPQCPAADFQRLIAPAPAA